ncbi:Tat pathway signal protein [Desulfofustis glycolicus]|uniref:Uncharacterized protein n=1 Tax=Desulfofustis glycolicus DSM 9705 TaxID=1121409 RepID=A0A1M5SMW9_9BACT|nr:Tat pathway signal protein [Desulfofustis glycolicus]MCB2215629.1 Tat pathway signal protein [Desulfobulbaceae bacterium]SHH39919.1 hypothetical protein SAMN02745124_00446 [Desulfofustis glycolicus DSM 9705]
MDEERRKLLKSTVAVGAVGIGTLIAAKCGVAADEGDSAGVSNGVVVGHSPKKEVLYRKTSDWDMYYKAAY